MDLHVLMFSAVAVVTIAISDAAEYLADIHKRPTVSDHLDLLIPLGI